MKGMTSVVMVIALGLGGIGCAWADDSAEVEALKAQLADFQKETAQQMAAMQSKIDQLGAAAKAPAIAIGGNAPASSPLSAHVGGADVTLYGFVDVSGDSTNDGRDHLNQFSSNQSYLGVRGGKDLGSSGLRAIFQIETLAAITSTPTETSSLGSRNSYLGLKGDWGKLMIGKYDTPYKRSTAMMDPFSGSVGDYNSVMGNTAGESRPEFDFRMPHSIFYDSPVWNGFSLYALVSPGQKLNNLPAASNYAFPQGEKVCSGSTPGASGDLPNGNVCNDGSFKTATSIALNYQEGPWFSVISYERHNSVDRTSDHFGIVADESAAKIGLSYHFDGNQLSGIYEKFFRGGTIAPIYNERTRDGYYISDVQDLGHQTDFMLAWAHAGQTPGSPHFGDMDDRVNMTSLGLKYHYDAQTAVYLVAALLTEGAGAHYALGAGGHGIPIASPRSNTGGNFPGQRLDAISVGLQYAF